MTIKGNYETVISRLNHPLAIQRSQLNSIVDTVKKTQIAGLATGGGIQSEIYKATEFVLNDTWNVRESPRGQAPGILLDRL